MPPLPAREVGTEPHSNARSEFREGCVRRSLCLRDSLEGTTSLHADLGLQILDVAKDRGDGEGASVAPKAQQAIPGVDVAVHGDLVPCLRMADVIDRNVVVLAPERRDGIEGLASPEHIQRRDLSLAFRDHPVLDPNGLAGARIWPARDVAGGEDARSAGLQHGVHRNAAIDLEARGLGEPYPWAHAETPDDEVSIQNRAARQP